MTRKVQTQSSKQKLQQILEQDQMLCDFSDASKQQFLSKAVVQKFLPEQLILQQDQYVQDLYILLSGCIQTGWLQVNGQFKIHQYLNITSAFNLAALIQHQPMSYDYFAADRVEVAVLSGDLFLSELKQQPDALWQLLNLVTKRMYRLFQQNHYLKTADLSQKIAHHLLSLLNVERHLDANQCQVSMKMSQQLLANMFGVSRQTLNKHIQLLHKRGILNWRQGSVEVLDLKALLSLSQLR